MINTQNSVCPNFDVVLMKDNKFRMINMQDNTNITSYKQAISILKNLNAININNMEFVGDQNFTFSLPRLEIEKIIQCRANEVESDLRKISFFEKLFSDDYEIKRLSDQIKTFSAENIGIFTLKSEPNLFVLISSYMGLLTNSSFSKTCKFIRNFTNPNSLKQFEKIKPILLAKLERRKEIEAQIIEAEKRRNRLAIDDKTDRRIARLR